MIQFLKQLQILLLSLSPLPPSAPLFLPFLLGLSLSLPLPPSNSDAGQTLQESLQDLWIKKGIKWATKMGPWTLQSDLFKTKKM